MTSIHVRQVPQSSLHLHCLRSIALAANDTLLYTALELAKGTSSSRSSSLAYTSVSNKNPSFSPLLLHLLPLLFSPLSPLRLLSRII